jgi:hypothetical protein
MDTHWNLPSPHSLETAPPISSLVSVTQAPWQQPVSIDQYTIVTATSSPERDPVQWALYGAKATLLLPRTLTLSSGRHRWYPLSRLGLQEPNAPWTRLHHQFNGEPKFHIPIKRSHVQLGLALRLGHIPIKRSRVPTVRKLVCI